MDGGEKIIYKDLCYKLNGIFFKIHNELGRFAREKQYADLAEEYFKKQGINYKREFEIKFVNQDKSVGGNRVDFLIDNKIDLIYTKDSVENLNLTEIRNDIYFFNDVLKK